MAAPLYKITIKQIIKETKDSVSFVFDIPKEYQSLFFYTPAQFLTFEFKIKNKTFLRSYSLSSSNFVDKNLKTTVKRVKNGIVSNYMIDNLKIGDTLLSRKPAGKLFKPPKDLKPKHYFLFAGGSGITPLFSIIKTVLLSDSKNKVTLFYANKEESNVIYQPELIQVLTHYKNQFNIVYIFSQSKNNQSKNILGRLQTKHLEKYFFNITVNNPHHLYYLCGPLGFMSTVELFLIQKNTKKIQIHKENFYSATQKKQLLSELSVDQKLSSPPQNTEPSELEPEISLIGKQGIGNPITKNIPKIIKAIIDKESIEIPAQKDIPILEQLLSAGYSPPFSCLSGSCMSCMAVLNKGKIHQQERGILEEENLKNHEILTCQATPQSQLVEINYDNL